jgi:hypothetical protein
LVQGGRPVEQLSVDNALSVPHVSACATNPSELVGAVERCGCVIVDSLVAPDALDALRQELGGLLVEAPLGANEFTGHATRLAYDPLARTRALDDVVVHPLLRASL